MIYCNTFTTFIERILHSCVLSNNFGIDEKGNKICSCILFTSSRTISQQQNPEIKL